MLPTIFWTIIFVSNLQSENENVFNIFHLKNFPMVFKNLKSNKFCTLKPCPKNLKHIRDSDLAKVGILMEC